MTKQDIHDILDKNVKSTRTGMIIGTVVGWAFFLTGVILFFTLSGDDGPIVGAMLGGLGLIIGALTLVPLMTGSFEKRTQAIKSILDQNPAHLVWAYVYQQNNRGAVSVNVVMNFKDGKTFMVDQNAIPNKDTSGFMHALRTLNPSMHMGFSDELEYKFKQRSL